MDKKKIPKKESGEISRREFLKDAGLIVGGAAIGSTVLLAACGDGEVSTETVTQTQTQTQTETITTTQQVGEVTKTVTETVSTFICPYDGQEFGTLSALQAHVEAAHPAEPAIEGLLKLTANGEIYELKIEPQWTLADVLRDKLGLTGTKLSCDRGECGACTVLVDGRPILSCMTLAIKYEGSDIRTIEDLPEDNQIIKSFVENHGVQCGFCIPGIIMNTKALLDRNASPTDQDVREALAGNLCRCGAQPKIIESVLDAAQKLRG